MKLIAASLKRLALAVLTLILVVGTFAISTPTASADTVQIKMGADNGMLAFQPKEVTIKAGDTVEWVNNKLAPHNVVVEGNEELSHKQLLMAPGTTITSTFTEPGTYTYWCEPHRGAGMVGKVVVQ
ncbi:MAG: plastocyanin [Nostocales cyanobacterium]|nr:MAG: plastocyanin [Nostocales cyanobacterium]TAF09331.1 MAG: plastocyanin [Nostocales cyanobacterium]